MGDFSRAGYTDNLEDTLNYAELAERVRDLAASKPYALIEHLAETLAAEVLTYTQLQATRVTITKRGAVAEAESVAICIFRQRSSA